MMALSLTRSLHSNHDDFLQQINAFRPHIQWYSDGQSTSSQAHELVELLLVVAAAARISIHSMCSVGIQLTDPGCNEMHNENGTC